jgi:putative ABC transport system ATP-binding protein
MMEIQPDPSLAEVTNIGQAQSSGRVENIVIETIDLRRTYRIGAHQEVHALRGANLHIVEGSCVAVKGRSGSGKTTLLNCIGGLDRPTSGVVRVFGRDLTKLSDAELTHYHRKQVGFIFQAFGLTSTYSAFENVELILRIAGAGVQHRKERTLHCLDLVGLAKWRNHRPNEMSGGQQQRLAIARALANQPRIILADEPTGKLDTATAREIFALFRRIVAEEGVTVVMAAHDPLVDEYANQVLRLKDGNILEG